METHNDYQNRLPEHEQPLELPAHEEKRAAAAYHRRAPKAAPIAAAADTAVGHSGSSFTAAILTALALLFVLGAIYLIPKWAENAKSPTRYAATEQYRDASNPYSFIAVTEEFDEYATPQTSNAYANSVNGISDAELAAINATPDDVVYLFPLNGATIADNAQLNALARKAAANGGTITVIAYTDESGRQAYNQQLSERRARSVGDYLVAHGVAPDHVITQGRGETHAYATPAQDRRAEVHLKS